VADRGWERSFDEPIPLPPRVARLVTLEDAGKYNHESFQKNEHEAAERRAAMEALILVANVRAGPNDVRAHWIMRALKPRLTFSGV